MRGRGRNVIVSLMVLSEQQRDWLTLALVPGVGSTYFIRLLARFRTPDAVLRASEGALREVVGPSLASRIRQYSQSVDIRTQERLMDEYGVSLVTMDDEAYPPRLAEIYDPPLALFVRGNLRPEDEASVAMVGTRKASPYGVHMAETLARELAQRGITVVSGMATGIDSAAHRGAMEGGGRTIAVLGNGVDVVYPKQNADLMHEITMKGAVVSQFPMGIEPSKGHFPFRNRIISGMTLGTVVIEAPIRSGALITARHAADQGREVFAVPGRAHENNSSGPHALIREGAKLVETVDDILVELDVPSKARAIPDAAPAAAAGGHSDESKVDKTATQVSANVDRHLSDIQEDVLSSLSYDGSFVDEIAAVCQLSVSETLSSLTVLELKGLIRQFSGKRFAPR